MAVLFNPATAPFAGLMMRVIEESAPSLAVAARAAPCHDGTEIKAMMAGLAREERGGLVVLPENFNMVHIDAIIALAARYHLPAVYPYRSLTDVGGLMSYGIDQKYLFRRAASNVDRILKGAKPADLPVQNPNKFELVINLKTARALSITVAPSLLATAAGAAGVDRQSSWFEYFKYAHHRVFQQVDGFTRRPLRLDSCRSARASAM